MTLQFHVYEKIAIVDVLREELKLRKAAWCSLDFLRIGR